MNATCSACAAPIDPENATPIHVRDDTGAYMRTIFVCATERACYDNAQTAIEHDGEQIGSTPSREETGTRWRT